MKVLVTGAAGFGASGLIAELVKRGEQVTCVDVVGANQAPHLSDEVLDEVRWLWKAVHDVWPEDIEGHDVVVHLAAQADVPMGHSSPEWTVWENVNGAVALLEAIRKCEVLPAKVIYAGSGNEYGRPEYMPIDEKHPLTPHNPYAFSKAAAELAFRAYERCYQIPVTVMSNGVVVGPGMRREIFVYKWFKNILRGKPLVLEGGDQTRDITYVTDVQQAWVKAIYAANDLVAGEKFQVSYGNEHPVEQILGWCLEIAGAPLDYPVVRKDYRPGEQGQRECFSNKHARAVLGYFPTVEPYVALEKTWDWMKAEYESKQKEVVHAE